MIRTRSRSTGWLLGRWVLVGAVTIGVALSFLAGACGDSEEGTPPTVGPSRDPTGAAATGSSPSPLLVLTPLATATPAGPTPSPAEPPSAKVTKDVIDVIAAHIASGGVEGKALSLTDPPICEDVEALLRLAPTEEERIRMSSGHIGRLCLPLAFTAFDGSRATILTGYFSSDVFWELDLVWGDSGWVVTGGRPHINPDG